MLDCIHQVFGPSLEQAGVPWLALDNAKRRSVALTVLAQSPLLWIWDNVEPVAGFPTGTPSTWSEPEQRELADFLRDCRATKAKFLLTSRRDERSWLGDLPRPIAVGPMPMQERVQLARGRWPRNMAGGSPMSMTGAPVDAVYRGKSADDHRGGGPGPS